MSRSADEIEALTDEIKADMDRQGVDTLEAGKHTIRWAVVKSSRFDSRAFRETLSQHLRPVHQIHRGWAVHSGMKEGRITKECWLELYHTCKSVLDNHGGDPEAAKAWVEKVFESYENISHQVHELFFKGH